MGENIAFAVVLFLALYGVVEIIRHIGFWILKPDRGYAVFWLTYIDADTDNIEQLIRYFRSTATREETLLLVDNGMRADTRAVVEKMTAGYGNIRLLTDIAICDKI